MNASAQESLLQLLVDGELDHAQRSEWLTSIDSDSPLWREMALAFVQNQILDEAIGDGHRQPDDPVELALRSLPIQTQSNKTRRRMTTAWLALAMAGCLAVGLFLGTLLNPGGKSPLENIVGAEKMDADATISADSQLVEHPEIDGPDIELADALARCSAPVLPEFRRSLLESGYVVDEFDKLANVQLPNGGSIKMPIRQVNIHYLGMNAYQ